MAIFKEFRQKRAVLRLTSTLLHKKGYKKILLLKDLTQLGFNLGHFHRLLEK